MKLSLSTIAGSLTGSPQRTICDQTDTLFQFWKLSKVLNQNLQAGQNRLLEENQIRNQVAFRF